MITEEELLLLLRTIESLRLLRFSNYEREFLMKIFCEDEDEDEDQ